MKRLFDIDPWEIKTTSLDKMNKRLQESITSIGNGYMGMRGNFEEGYSGDTHIGTYLAGVWYPDKTRVGWWKIGYPEYFGKVINATNFIPIAIYVNDEKVDLAVDAVKEFNLSLNMQEGILRRSYVWSKENTEIRFSFKRYVSIVQKELAVIEVKAEILKGSATVKFDSYLDGDVENEDSNYEEKFWIERQRDSNEKSYLTTDTIENPFGTEQFTVTTMMQNLAEGNSHRETRNQHMLVGETIAFELGEGEQALITKLVTVVTSRDIAAEQQVQEASNLLDAAVLKGTEQLEAEHKAAWKER